MPRNQLYSLIHILTNAFFGSIFEKLKQKKRSLFPKALLRYRVQFLANFIAGAESAPC